METVYRQRVYLVQMTLEGCINIVFEHSLFLIINKKMYVIYKIRNISFLFIEN